FFPRSLGSEQAEGVEGRLGVLDPLHGRVEQLDGAQLPRRELFGQVSEAHGERIAIFQAPSTLLRASARLQDCSMRASAGPSERRVRGPVPRATSPARRTASCSTSISVRRAISWARIAPTSSRPWTAVPS